jgi:putative SOS response-associated peptidase YedK
MCGRYDNLIAKDAYRALFKADRLPRSNFPPRYNIAPTDQIPIIRVDPRDGERELVMARWGLIPFWMKSLGTTNRRQVSASVGIMPSAQPAVVPQFEISALRFL